MFAAVFGAKFGGHFHAEGVDVAEEGKRLLGHSVAQTGPANEDGRFHEGAGGVTQEDPVDGVVDGGFETGAVEVDVVEIDVFFKAEVDGTGGAMSPGE